MTTAHAESENCSISSLFSMSCRGRADSFARRLHARLSSLGAQGTAAAARQPPDETTWLAAGESSVAVTQPPHSGADLYLDIAIIDPGSPEEENPDHADIINNEKDDLGPVQCKETNNNNDTMRPALSTMSSSDGSDSSGQYYEVETEKLEHDCSESSFSSLEYSSCLQEGDRTTTDDSFNSVDECKEEFDHSNETEQTKFEETWNVDDKKKADWDLHKNDINNICNIRLDGYNEKMKCNNCNITDCDLECDNITIGNVNGSDEIDAIVAHVDGSKLETEILDVKLACDKIIISDENGIDHEEESPRVRRCSSLKTGKTPPGTPSRKKIVRFADVLGLDLADVRTFLDEIPRVPNSAYNDLRDAHSFYVFKPCKSDSVLVPLFVQPGGQNDFLQRVRDNNVCLENALVEDCALMSVRGTVRVRNLDFHKSVHIRYTLDGWRSYSDLQCSYLANSCDGFSDKFAFLLYANTIKIGERLEFAVRFQCKGLQYWDNNKGANYCFQCLPATTSTSYTPITAEEPWGSHFY